MYDSFGLFIGADCVASRELVLINASSQVAQREWNWTHSMAGAFTYSLYDDDFFSALNVKR